MAWIHYIFFAFARCYGILCCSPRLASLPSYAELLLRQFSFDAGICDELLTLFWPLLGPFYFIYIKICTPNDQSSQRKFYAMNFMEIFLEAFPQTIIQWKVIADNSEIFEGNGHILGTDMEYNKFRWAIFSAVISTVSLLNGLRLFYYELIYKHLLKHGINNDQ